MRLLNFAKRSWWKII